MTTHIHSLNRKINWLLLIFIFITLLPFICLSFYIHLYYDDYDFLNKLRGQSLFENTIYWYNSWSGRYSSNFLANILTTQSEHIFIYRLYPIFLMGLYIIAFYTLFKTVAGNLISRKKLLVLSFLFLILYISRIPEITTGFYYMICSYISSTGTIAFIFLLSLLIKLLEPERNNKIWLLLAAGSLSFYIGGSYESTMCMSLTYISLIAFLLFAKKNPHLKWVVIIAIILFVCSIISVIAPGNKVRSGDELLQVQQNNIVSFITKDFKLSLNLVVNTLQNPLLLVGLLLFIPFATAIGQNNKHVRSLLSFNPIVAFAGMFIITAGAFAPSASVNNCPPRVVNLIYLVTMLNLFICVQITVIYYLNKNLSVDTNPTQTVLFKIILIICLIPSLTNKTVGRAYSDLFFKTTTYSMRMNSRNEYIQTQKALGNKDIILPPLFTDPKQYPLSIYYNFQELEIDPNDSVNKLYAKYWGLNSIILGDRTDIDFINQSRAN